MVNDLFRQYWFITQLVEAVHKNEEKTHHEMQLSFCTLTFAKLFLQREGSQTSVQKGGGPGWPAATFTAGTDPSSKFPIVISLQVNRIFKSPFEQKAWDRRKSAVTNTCILWTYFIQSYEPFIWLLFLSFSVWTIPPSRLLLHLLSIQNGARNFSAAFTMILHFSSNPIPWSIP